MENKYLCAIGTTLSDIPTDYEVGTFNKERNTFSFPNGSYSNIEMALNEKLGTNIACVLKAKKIDDIDLGE